MRNEYDALIKNGTWKLVDLPNGTKPIGCKWVYKNKYKLDGSLNKHKERLVAKGYAQKRANYKETFSPTTKWDTKIFKSVHQMKLERQDQEVQPDKKMEEKQIT